MRIPKNKAQVVLLHTALSRPVLDPELEDEFQLMDKMVTPLKYDVDVAESARNTLVNTTNLRLHKCFKHYPVGYEFIEELEEIKRQLAKDAGQQADLQQLVASMDEHKKVTFTLIVGEEVTMTVDPPDAKEKLQTAHNFHMSIRANSTPTFQEKHAESLQQIDDKFQQVRNDIFRAALLPFGDSMTSLLGSSPFL